MTDVRHLLRAERANRRLTHPHASYTKDGKLLCNLCDTLLKSESQWQSHLHSTQHLLRTQRAKETAHVRSSGAKKRKAESPAVEEDVDERKRARASEDGVAINGDGGRITTPTQPSHTTQDPLVEQPSHPPSADGAQDATADEAELAAFEQELLRLEQETAAATTAYPAANSVVDAAVTISAAPMTAEELAANAKEEQSVERGTRDGEMEAEREDAARLLEDEFEAMQGLEERVRRLREQREALRKPLDAGRDAPGIERDTHVTTTEAHDEDDASDDYDDDDDDDWAFGGN